MTFGIHRNFPAGGSTADATAKQWDIKNGKTAYIASGKVNGSGYFPAMMLFDGSTGVYTADYTVTAHTGLTIIGRIKLSAFTGGITQIICQQRVTSGSILAQLSVHASDHASVVRRNKLFFVVQNAAGANIARLISTIDVTDDINHTFFAAYDATAGTAIMRIDGVDVLDTGNADHILTTGTRANGAGSFGVGGQSIASSPFWTGSIGYCGFREAYITNWSDFMHPDGSPKNIEATLSTVWGGPPLFWHESAKMDENKGSAGNMTKNGSIILAPASSWS